MKRISTSCKAAKPTLALALAIALCLPLAGCGAAKAADTAPETEKPAATASPEAMEKHQTQVFAMDTVMILTAYGAYADEALDAAAERLYALEADLDPGNETGSVYAANAGAGGQVVVSEDSFQVMTTAMRYWRLSGGALDPGLYPLSKAWGFIGGDYRVPDAEEIALLLAVKDTGGVRLDEAATAVAVPAGTEVSFGAVAKGYAAQAVVDLMADMGVTSAILSLGGNVQTLGETKPDGSRWQVAVTDPYDTGAYAGILTVGQAAVVTSGGYQRFFEEDGVTYIHILDPETGYPVDNDLLSVTVVTADGTAADALSTTLFVMGAERALRFYEEQGDFELVLITKDDEIIVTPGLADSFTETEPDLFTYTYYEPGG